MMRSRTLKEVDISLLLLRFKSFPYTFATVAHDIILFQSNPSPSIMAARYPKRKRAADAAEAGPSKRRAVAALPEPSVTTFQGATLSRSVWTGYDHHAFLRPGGEGTIELRRARKGIEAPKLLVIKTFRYDAELQPDESEHGEWTGWPQEIKILMGTIGPAMAPGHRNLVDVFEGTRSARKDPTLSRWHLSMELCDGGNLGDLINLYYETHETALPDIFALHTFVHLGQALAFVHNGIKVHQDGHTETIDDWTPIMHGDIKTDNVLLRWHSRNEHGMPDLVLADFGQAQINTEVLDYAGTPQWLPPEVWTRRRYPGRRDHAPITIATDVWTYAAVIWMVITHHIPKADDNLNKLPWRRFAFRNMAHWLRAMLHFDPEQRPKFTSGPFARRPGVSILEAVKQARKKRDQLVMRDADEHGVIDYLQDIWGELVSDSTDPDDKKGDSSFALESEEAEDDSPDHYSDEDEQARDEEADYEEGQY